MLSHLIRKLCPLMSLTLLTVGCGKQITDSAPEVTNRNIENQVMPRAYVVRLDGSRSSWKNYFLPGNAQFEIPEAIYVRSGMTTNKRVEVAYDINPDNLEQFLFKCSYIPSFSSALMELEGCVNSDYERVDMVGQPQSMEKNRVIQVRFTGAASPDLIVEAIFDMTWI